MEQVWTDPHQRFIRALREKRLKQMDNDHLYKLRQHWDLVKRTEHFLRPLLQVNLFQMVCEATPPLGGAPARKRPAIDPIVVQGLPMLPEDLALLVAAFVGLPSPKPVAALPVVPEWQDGMYGMLPQPNCCVKTI